MPPEIVFDQGVGDLFVVRVAGNFESDEATGTFEYGVAELGVHTIVVLGHTKCGAIKGAIDKKKEGKKKDVEMKEKKEKPKPKATIEDLDAELLSYQAARAADGSAPTGMEAAPAPA